MGDTMFRASVSGIFAMLLGGCAAEMVNRPGGTSTSEFAPINEKARTGIVRYLNDGADFVTARRREDAYQRMYEACDGPYSIVAEGPRNEGGAVIPLDDLQFATPTQYWYIEFRCEPAQD